MSFLKEHDKYLKKVGVFFLCLFLLPLFSFLLHLLFTFGTISGTWLRAVSEGIICIS